MPYEIKHNIEGCSGYAVVLSNSGKIVTCHPDKESALKHLAALEINVEEAKMDKSDSKKVGQFVTWNSSGGMAHGKIVRIVRDGKVKVPGSSFEITGTSEDPAALIRIYQKVEGKWKPTDTIVGHKVSTLKSDNVEKLFMFGGSKEFKVEYNVGDCQGGWAVLKDGTGEVVGCHKTEAEAVDHKELLTVEMQDILGSEVRTAKSPSEYAETKKSYDAASIWDGVFFPAKKGIMGIDNDTKEENARFVSTYNTPPQKDGLDSAGYGNRSAGTNPK